jgi:hypothetical protein
MCGPTDYPPRLWSWARRTNSSRPVGPGKFGRCHLAVFRRPDIAATVLRLDQPWAVAAYQPKPDGAIAPRKPRKSPEMTNPNFSIFTSTGTISDNIDPLEVEKLDEHEKSVLADTLFHCRAAEAGETNVNELRLKVRSLMDRYNSALETDNLANPGQTFLEAHAAVVHANNPHAPKPKPRKVNAKTRASLVQASYELAQCRDDFQRAISSQKGLDKSRGESIVRFMKTQRPITFADLHAEHCAKSNADRLARVEQGLDPNVSPVEPIRLAQIDRDYAARGAIKKKPVYLGTRNRF